MKKELDEIISSVEPAASKTPYPEVYKYIEREFAVGKKYKNY